MSIQEILQTGANVQLVINALDLKEAFLQWNDEHLQQRNLVPAPPEKYFTAQEAAERLGVDVSTLWRWDRSGYLKKIKVGTKNRYRESDVLKLMEG